MNSDTSSTNEPLLLHVSIGSAATDIHFSIDLPLHYTDRDKVISDMMKLWYDASLVRAIYKNKQGR